MTSETEIDEQYRVVNDQYKIISEERKKSGAQTRPWVQVECTRCGFTYEAWKQTIQRKTNCQNCLSAANPKPAVLKNDFAGNCAPSCEIATVDLTQEFQEKHIAPEREVVRENFETAKEPVVVAAQNNASVPTSPEQEFTINLQQKIDAVNRAKDEAAYSVINLGKRLCELKSECVHGTFTEIAEKHCELGKRQCQNLMQIHRSFGEKRTAVRFSTKALLELSKSPSPVQALTEANERKEQGESITAKQAKEITTLHKDIERLKETEKERLPNLDNLIPGLARLHNSGSLPKVTALEFSKLDPSIQKNVVLPKFEAERRLQSQIDSLEKEKSHALGRESKAREERETLQADYDSAVEQGAQKVIAEKEKEIQRKAKELDHLKIDMRDEIERTQGEAIEKRVRDEYEEKLSNERKAKESAERKLSAAKESINRIGDDELRERARAEKAEAELAAVQPLEKDERHARSLKFILSNLQSTLKNIKHDCESYQRERSEKVVQDFIEELQEFLGSAPAIIDI